MKNEKSAVATKSTTHRTAPIKLPHNTQTIHEAICLKAYELYSQRQGAPGSDVEDWLKAEQMVQKDLLNMINDAKRRNAGD